MSNSYVERLTLSTGEAIELRRAEQTLSSLVIVCSGIAACGHKFEIGYITDAHTNQPKLQIPKPLGRDAAVALAQRLCKPFTPFY